MPKTQIQIIELLRDILNGTYDPKGERQCHPHTVKLHQQAIAVGRSDIKRRKIKNDIQYRL